MAIGNYRSASAPADAMENSERKLLQCLVELTRSVFDAAAASIFLVDEPNGELVFEAVSGDGEGILPGTRMPLGAGIAGWVVSSGQPMVVDDVDSEPLFARDVAGQTGFVPKSIMAAPLLRNGSCVGVIEVLDRVPGIRDELADIRLLALVAAQATLSLEILVRLEQATQVWAPDDGGLPVAVLNEIATLLAGASETTTAAVVKVLEVAKTVLTNAGTTD